MGVSQSLPEGAKPLSGNLKKFMDHTDDSLLVFHKCASDMAVKFDNTISSLMTDYERRKFTDLMTRRELLVDQVDLFALKENRRYKSILAHVGKGERHMHQLFKSSGTEAQIATCEDLANKLTTLSYDFKEYYEELKGAMKKDGRMNRRTTGDITKWLSALLLVGAAIGCIVLVILHFVPGVNIALGAVELVAAAVGAGALVGTGLVVALSKNEVERALEYINHLAENLTNMKEILLQLQADNVVLLDEEVHVFQETMEALITRTDNIHLLCKQARA